MTRQFAILSPVKGTSLRTAKALVHAGLVTSEQRDDMERMSERYAISVTPEMQAAMTSANDPVGLQFIPDIREMDILPQELSDPIGDDKHAPMKALVHRYKNRVLLKPTNVCAVYCRFCFRRDMVGPGGDSIMQKDVDVALDYIEQHPEIEEIILTGGDPLMLAVKRLQPLMQRLHAIKHVRWIRFHTRIPVVSPSKISDELIACLAGEKRIIMAIHANHANEFTPAAKDALERLTRQGVMLLGQSVLLKGINSSVSALVDLCETMIDHHIKPYYLHHPDLTVGTSHFRFSFEEGIELVNQLHQRVSGICMPQYTLDIPGGFSKIAINRDTVQAVEGKKGHYKLRDSHGSIHDYVDELPA